MIKVSFDTPGSLGDWLCMISATREYARRHVDEEVYLPKLGDVLDAYGDGLVKLGRCPNDRVVRPIHREKHQSTRHNYLGTFLRELCPEITEPMNLKLPNFVTTGEQMAIIQPYSGFAHNPPRAYLQTLVDAFVDLTGRKLYAVGNAQTKQDLARVDYTLLADSVPRFLRHVTQADFVLTPRSACAHAAAGYGIPSFVWVPDDGENWHLDYPAWRHRRHYHRYGVQDALAALNDFWTQLKVASTDQP